MKRQSTRPRSNQVLGVKRTLRTALVLGLVAMFASLLAAAPASAGDNTYEYEFVFENGIVLTGVSSDKTYFLAGAGGTDVNNPIGMEVHLSCSDEFSGGWGEKDGPEQGRDSAWRIATWSISKLKDGRVDKTCGGAPIPPPPPSPDIDLEKTINGYEADTPEAAVQLALGEAFTLGYRVTNTGDAVLHGVYVDDPMLGMIPCPQDVLQPGESMDCEDQPGVASEPGPMFMEASAHGYALIATQPTIGSGKHSFSFTFVNGITISGNSDDKTHFIANAGGTDVNNPIGMEVHLSCSDEFSGGWGEKDGPEQGRDSAWQIASWSIAEIKDGKIKKQCGDAFPDIREDVWAYDPIHYDVPPSNPKIVIIKTVNGYDANNPTGPELEVGSEATFGYQVMNMGDVILTNVTVIDDVLGLITCPSTELDPGETMDCRSTSMKVEEGQQFMSATVTGTPPVGDDVMDDDPAFYFGVKAKKYGAIGDTVWNDSNANGVQDGGEPGIAGVRVVLLHNFARVGVAVTNGDGTYYFPDLDDGVYRVGVVQNTLPSGAVQTYDASGSLDNRSDVDLGGGEVNLDQDFGYVLAGD